MLQITMDELGLFDQFDCNKCAWMKTHGFCYPKETLKRQRFVMKKEGRICSDYCTAYAHVKDERRK